MAILVGAIYLVLAGVILADVPGTLARIDREPEDFWVEVWLFATFVFFGISATLGGYVSLRLGQCKPVLVLMNGAAILLHILTAGAALISPLDRMMLVIVVPATLAFALLLLALMQSGTAATLTRQES